MCLCLFFLHTLSFVVSCFKFWQARKLLQLHSQELFRHKGDILVKTINLGSALALWWRQSLPSCSECCFPVRGVSVSACTLPYTSEHNFHSLLDLSWEGLSGLSCHKYTHTQTHTTIPALLQPETLSTCRCKRAFHTRVNLYAWLRKLKVTACDHTDACSSKQTLVFLQRPAPTQVFFPQRFECWLTLSVSLGPEVGCNLSWLKLFELFPDLLCLKTRCLH